MKRALTFLIVGTLVAGSLGAPASAGKRKKKPKRVEHVVELTYNGGHLGANTPVVSGGACVNGQDAFACLVTPTTTLDKYVKVEVQDSSGQKAGGFLSQNDADGDGLKDGYGNFCGAGSESVPIETPGAVLEVSLYAGVCADGSPSVVTSGKVVLTFSNQP